MLLIHSVQNHKARTARDVSPYQVRSNRRGSEDGFALAVKIFIGFVAVMVATGFIFTIVMMFNIFGNGNGYSYKVEYQVGEYSHSEEVSYGN